MEKEDKEIIHQLDLEVNKLSFFIERNLIGLSDNSGKNLFKFEKSNLLEKLSDALFKYYKEGDNLLLLKDFRGIVEFLRMNSNKFSFENFEKIKRTLRKLKSKKSNKRFYEVYLNLSELNALDLKINIDKLVTKL